MAFRKLITSYGNLLKNYPTPTQAVQTGFLMGSGDVLAQTLVEKRKLSEVDWKRTIPYASAGIFVGPTVGTWYRFLEYRLGSGSVKILVKKIACDQLIFAPCFLVILVSSLNALKGQTFSEVKQNLKTNYGDILVANYKIWPFVQLVNFYFVPLHFRVLLVQAVAVLWNTYLSWKINSVTPQLIPSDAIKIGQS